MALDVDTLQLTQGAHRGNIVHKALLINGINVHILDPTVTYSDASHYSSLYPGHLEQLSIACPNITYRNLICMVTPIALATYRDYIALPTIVRVYRR